MIDAGEILDLEYLKLPKDRYEVMRKAYLKCGDEKLKTSLWVFRRKYSYDELKLVRVLLRLRASPEATLVKESDETIFSSPNFLAKIFLTAGIRELPPVIKTASIDSSVYRLFYRYLLNRLLL